MRPGVAANVGDGVCHVPSGGGRIMSDGPTLGPADLIAWLGGVCSGTPLGRYTFPSVVNK